MVNIEIFQFTNSPGTKYFSVPMHEANSKEAMVS